MRGLFFLPSSASARRSPAASGAAAQIADFCPLLDGRIVADDGVFLGRITTDPIATDSILNPTTYGSQLNANSIFNQSTYGGMFHPLGPFNPSSFNPPRIQRFSQTIARLTVNTSFANRVDPNGLVAWLRSAQPAQCGGETPLPTATRTPTAEDTPTETETATPPATPTPPFTSTARGRGRGDVCNEAAEPRRQVNT